MENLRNLESGLKDLSTKFKQDLINELSNKGHNKSGKLEKSIQFNFTSTGYEYKIQLECLDYIKYLDKGKFLEDFLSKKTIELEEKLPEFIEKDIIEQLNNI